MITRYFAVDPGTVEGYIVTLFTDNDFLPLTKLSIIPGVLLSNGKQLVKAILPMYIVKDMQEHCLDYSIMISLSPEGVDVLDLRGTYVGETREEVLKQFPELDRKISAGFDEDGTEIFKDAFPVMRWSAEDSDA